MTVYLKYLIKRSIGEMLGIFYILLCSFAYVRLSFFLLEEITFDSLCVAGGFDGVRCWAARPGEWGVFCHSRILPDRARVNKTAPGYSTESLDWIQRDHRPLQFRKTASPRSSDLHLLQHWLGLACVTSSSRFFLRREGGCTQAGSGHVSLLDKSQSRLRGE